MGQVFVLSNYCIKYARDERVKYISHLDFIRMFHRTVRRAGLLMKFSEGFNPHPVMTVAMPLSVGITSESEYMKISFAEGYAENEIKDRINEAFPKGFEVIKVVKTEGKQHDFSKLDRALYEVIIEASGIENFDAEKFLEKSELIVMKKTKSGEKESDIRPYIYSLKETKREENKLFLTMCIATGNSYNLKVETVVSAMDKYIDGFESEFISVHRKKILAGKKELI